MAEDFKIIPVRSLPGIKRDGTDTEGNYWNDGLWSRFYRGLPRSMLGYRSMSEILNGPSRGLFTDSGIVPGFFNVFNGTASNIQVAQFNQNGFGSGTSDLTPSGFTTDPNNIWQIDSFYNSNGGGFTALVAHAAPNIFDIASPAGRPIYTGNINSTSALTASVDDTTPTPNIVTVAGGIVALHPYLVAYDINGRVIWSKLNDPTVFPVANAANPVSTKIVKGLSIRGGSTAPAALLWSIDSLIYMSFVGGSTIWNFDTLSDQSSILSSSGIVEMDGIYYWPGVDRFLMFNGVLQELQNDINLDYFYSNLSINWRQKVFGFKIPRWGEIWWCAPMFGSTECNHAIIYNKRLNAWYDTPLPSDGRSAAYFAQAWPYPIMASANGLTPIGQNTGMVYPLWQHEFGYDAVRGNNVDAIDSYILSGDFSLVGGGMSLFGNAAPLDSVETQTVRFEPDFLGKQQIISILGRKFAMDTDSLLDTRTIMRQPSNNSYDVQTQARYLRFKIESNSQGSSYIYGQPQLSFRTGDRDV